MGKRHAFAWKLAVAALRTIGGYEIQKGFPSRATKVFQKPRIGLPGGTKYRVNCRECSKPFGAVLPADGDAPSYYCSAGCKRRHSKRSFQRRSLGVTECPFPQKVMYPRQAQAQAALVAMRASHEEGYLLSEYACICGGFHLGRRELEVVEMGVWHG